MRKAILTRYRQLGLWSRLGVWGAIASIAGFLGFLLWPQGTSVSQNATLRASPGSTVIQSGRDTIISDGIHKRTTIQSLSFEGRLTCTLKPGVELPPSEVPFIPVSDASAYLDGPGGRPALAFVSPVKFRRLEDDLIIVINRFGLPPASDILGSPVERLSSFTSLLMPTITIVYGSSFDTMTVFEVTAWLNGDQVWSYVHPLGVPFQQGPVFTIPLKDLQRRIGSTE